MFRELLSRLGLHRGDDDPPLPPPPASDGSRSTASKTTDDQSGVATPIQPGPDDMAEVRPGAFVGSSFPASDTDALTERGIEQVLSLTEYRMESTTVYRPLNDGENEQDAFDDAVDAARRVIADDESALIHCAAGISRAPSVTATALAAEENTSFEEALETIQEVRPQANPHPLLRDYAEHYLRN